MADWEYVTRGRELDRVMLGGLDVWKHSWTPVDTEPVRVTDPVHGQEFHFPVYEMTYRGKRVVFAAGEFANGVWGFYQARSRPRPDEEEP